MWALEHAACRARALLGVTAVQQGIGNKVSLGFSSADVGLHLEGPDRGLFCGGDCAPYALTEVCIVL